MHFKSAEQFVADDLASKGWQVLARNFRRKHFELDIVASHSNILSIVEVKFRRHMYFFTARDLQNLLSRSKQNALLKGALYFVTARQIFPTTIRFDLAIVTAKRPQIHYFTNVMPQP